MLQDRSNLSGSCHILRLRVDATSYEDATRRVVAWARNKESRYVCVAPVSTVIEAHDSAEFRRTVNGADLVTPDGMPVVWGLRICGHRSATRVYGPDLTLSVLKAAAREAIPVGFCGGTDMVLERLVEVAKNRFPGLPVAYAYAPPFRPLSLEEDRKIVDDINASGARILFVGLGSPKQERWMGAHCGRVRAVMLGVGAAFDFLTGQKPQAPRWMQQGGLEWLFRLLTEPRRLWRRYLFGNSKFLVLFAMQLLNLRRFET